jgi:uncharacterized protein YqjF (DUF2071 family)
MSFLRAEWRKLILVNYEVDPGVLLGRVPVGTELDLYEGKALVSLVGFLFKDTRVLGMRVPFHVNFPEVNLRFYVRRKEEGEWRRGVTFIREIVPRRAITWVANTLYQEQYITRRMRYSWEEEDETQEIQYAWWEKGEWQEIRVEAGTQSALIDPTSETGFITEHYWGYTKGQKHTMAYEVTHPVWEAYPVLEHHVKVDFGRQYGAEFAGLEEEAPFSVMLAEGSLITVEAVKRLRI